MPFPKPPEKVIPFRSGAIAPHDLERQFDEHRRALLNVIDFLRTIVRDDGIVRDSSMPPPRSGATWSRISRAAPPAQAAGVLESSTQPPAPTGILGPNAGGKFAADDDGATAVAADYAQVCIDWAEHMPDTIPLQTLAVNAITGDHWSARWWANRAAQIVSSGTSLAPMSAERLTVTALNTCSHLTFTPAGPVLLILNGVSFLPVGASPPFSVSGTAISWLSTIYSLIPGQSELSAWYPYAP